MANLPPIVPTLVSDGSVTVKQFLRRHSLQASIRDLCHCSLGKLWQRLIPAMLMTPFSLHSGEMAMGPSVQCS